MRTTFVPSLAVVGLATALAVSTASAEPMKLTDGQMEQVTAGFDVYIPGTFGLCTGNCASFQGYVGETDAAGNFTVTPLTEPRPFPRFSLGIGW